VERPDDHRACEIRYRDLLGRLADMSQRMDQLEQAEREIVALLRDFRDLARRMAARLTAHDRQFRQMSARLVPFVRHDERVARHFRN
jgi:hypothetical protein